jgi:hypothetical protein
VVGGGGEGAAAGLLVLGVGRYDPHLRTHTSLDTILVIIIIIRIIRYNTGHNNNKNNKNKGNSPPWV